MSTAIESWLAGHGFRLHERRTTHETCYERPAGGGYLVLNDGERSEPPYWSLYYPDNEDGEQADESGEWDDTPNWPIS